MLFLPLLVLASVLSVPEAARGRARVQELRNRLGVAPVQARVRSTIRTRLAYAQRYAPAFAEVLQELVEEEVGEAGLDEHRPAFEAVLVWLARELRRGLRLSDLDWPQLLADDPLMNPDAEMNPETARSQFVTPAWFRPRVYRDVLDYTLDHLPIPSYAAWTEDGIHPWTGNGTFLSLDGVFLGPSWVLMAWAYPDAPLGPDGRPSGECALVSLAHLLGAEMDPLVDWVAQVHPDLSQVSYRAAKEASVAWHATFLSGGPVDFGGPVPVYPGDEVLQTYPDGGMLVQVASKRGLAAEGASMGHCVGGYWVNVRRGDCRIWSVRDGQRRPRLTVELEPGTGQVRQAMGPRNAPPYTWGKKREGALALLRAARAWGQQYGWKNPRWPKVWADLGFSPLVHQEDLDAVFRMVTDPDLTARLLAWGARYTAWLSALASSSFDSGGFHATGIPYVRMEDLGDPAFPFVLKPSLSAIRSPFVNGVVLPTRDTVSFLEILADLHQAAGRVVSTQLSMNEQGHFLSPGVISVVWDLPSVLATLTIRPAEGRDKTMEFDLFPRGTGYASPVPWREAASLVRTKFRTLPVLPSTEEAADALFAKMAKTKRVPFP